MGRGATGVHAMRLDEDGEDEVIGMISLTKPDGWDDKAVADDEEDVEVEETENDDTPQEAEDPTMPTILVLSEKGVGKRSAIDTYRITNRNGKGVKTINLTDKTGKLVAFKKVTLENDIMIINKSGVTIRLAVSDIKKSGRMTQGVKLIDIAKRNDVISSVCVVDHVDPKDLEEKEFDEDGNEIVTNTTPDDTTGTSATQNTTEE
jgi:DNA gyrase subunit A